jgi:outer membrane protein assembly factor BamB
MSLKSSARVMVAGTIAAALLGGGSLTVASAGPAIALKPASGPPTSLITVNGSGFGVTEAVDIYFDATDMTLAATDATGSFSIAFRVPASVQPGTHYVTAVGRASGLGAQKPFIVRTNWAQFHFGPDMRGVNPYENTLNSSNVSGLIESWQFSTGGPVESSPAVSGGIVYVGSDDDKVYALSATTGALKWTATTGGAVKSSPAVAGGVVYVGSDDGKVYALNASTGSAKWTDDLSSLEPSGFDSPPVVSGGRVFIGGDSANIYALDASTGFADWAVSSTCGGWTSPAVANGVVFANQRCGGGLYALSASTGTQLWTHSPAGINYAPTVANGVVYAGALGTFSGINAFEGSARWANSSFGGTENFSVAAVANGHVYTGSDDTNLWALDTAGNVSWHFSVQGSIYSSAAVADGVVYVGSSDDNLYARRRLHRSRTVEGDHGRPSQLVPRNCQRRGLCGFQRRQRVRVHAGSSAGHGGTAETDGAASGPQPEVGA